MNVSFLDMGTREPDASQHASAVQCYVRDKPRECFPSSVKANQIVMALAGAVYFQSAWHDD